MLVVHARLIDLYNSNKLNSTLIKYDREHELNQFDAL